MHPERLHSTEQPASDRWRGLAGSIHPALTRSEEWPAYAQEIDVAARAGIDISDEQPTLINGPRAADPGRTAPAPWAAPIAPAGPRPPERPPPAPPAAPRRGR